MTKEAQHSTLTISSNEEYNPVTEIQPLPEATARNIDWKAPGAYPVRGTTGNRSSRAPAGGSSRPHEDPHHTTTSLIMDNDISMQSGLVTAYTVEEDSQDGWPMPHAEPVHLKDQRDHKGPLSKFLLVGWLVALLATACIVGTILGKNQPTPAENHSSLRPQAYSPAPTEAPSSPLDFLMATLPDYTKESLQDPFSPQTQALNWLAEHQNITNLPEWRKTQLFALATFFYSMSGPNWPTHMLRSWLDDQVDECYWFSSNEGTFTANGSFVQGAALYSFFDMDYQFCNETTGQVVDLTLDSMALANTRATLPPEIELLTSLNYLFIMRSHIPGNLEDFIPTQFYHMSNLIEASFESNSFTGTIPTQLASMAPFLEYLDLGDNHLHGTIPTELGSMTKLTALYLCCNRLTGTLPIESWLLHNDLGNSSSSSSNSRLLLPNLNHFHVDDNGMTGTIPTELGLTALTMLHLQGNQFSGTLPKEIANLSLLHTLKVGSNEGLFGTIPTELGLLTALVRLHLDQLPLLTGTIPSELTHAVNLTEITFHASSALTGIIPDEFCSLQEEGCTKYFAYLEADWNCTLEFECSDLLCGCDCPCGGPF
jgi:Leucine-rich repeat (LRR) protein